MPRTLLLALIVTAMTASDRSGADPGLASIPDTARKPPDTGTGETRAGKLAQTDGALVP